MIQSETNREEASASLNVLKEIDQQAKLAFRAPIWLTGILSLSFGMATFSYCAMQHENMWALGVIISVTVFVLSAVFFTYISKLSGIRHRMIPATSRGKWLSFLQALVYSFVLLLGRYLADEGWLGVPYIAGLLNMSIMAIMLHKYPFLDNAGMED
jgi:phosphatidylglycerophosphate synthase